MRNRDAYNPGATLSRSDAIARARKIHRVYECGAIGRQERDLAIIDAAAQSVLPVADLEQAITARKQGVV